MGVQLTREQLQTLMMHLHQVPADKRIAMLGRMKHLQRLGWPPGSNLGKGKRVRYNPYQVASLSLALEMIQLGLTPERVVDTMEDQHEEILAILALDNEQMIEPSLLVFDPAALSAALGVEKGIEPAKSRAANGTAIQKWGSANRRTAIINVTMLLDDVDDTLRQLTFARAGEFRGELRRVARDFMN